MHESYVDFLSYSTALSFSFSLAPSRVPTAHPTTNKSLPTFIPTTVLPPTALPTNRPTAAPSIDPSLNAVQNTAMCALQSLFRWSIFHFGWTCSGGVATGLCGTAGNRWTGVYCDASNRVVSINLFNMGVKGTLPTQIALLTGLSSLDLHHNSLSGSIPTQMGLLTNLQYLALSDNLLTGSIPTQFGNLTQLNNLYLFGNQITGSIPASICQATYLYKFFPCNGIDATKCRYLGGCIPLCLNNVTQYNYAFLQYCSPGKSLDKSLVLFVILRFPLAPTFRPTPGPSATPT